MVLYVRKKPGWITYVRNDSLSSFIEGYWGGHVVLGDVSLMSSSAVQKLLKFTEEHPVDVDLYTSVDFWCPPLYSRALRVEKEYMTPVRGMDIKEWQGSRKTWQDALGCLGDLRESGQLLVPFLPPRFQSLLLSGVNG